MKEESLYTDVIAMRDVGQRNGPEVPMESWVLGVKALDRVVRECLILGCRLQCLE